MSGLPEGWERTDLLEVSGKLVDGSHNPPRKSTVGKPMLSARNVQNGKIIFDQYRLIREDDFDAEASRTRIQANDVLLTIVGALGRSAVVSESIQPFTLQRSVAVISPIEGLYSEYLSRWFSSPAFQRWIFENAKGTAQKGVYLKKLGCSELPLPPLAEQKRIVAKLDRLSARSGKVKEHLAAVQTLATRAKQATLAAAFRGELTTEWRKYSDNASEPKINLKPHADFEQGKWSSAEIPEEWSWMPFRDAFSDHTHSKKKIAQKLYQEAGRFPVVDQGVELIGGYSDDEALVQTTELPVVVFGDHTRCTKFIDFAFVQGADGVKVLKANSGIESRYAFWLIEAIELPDKGYSRHMKFLKASSFPIAPAAEQTEIVRRIEAAFSKIDRMVEQATRAADLLERLEQQLLAKAFRGELVPQDPSDEPASALLARIREARANAPKPKRKRAKT